MSGSLNMSVPAGIVRYFYWFLFLHYSLLGTNHRLNLAWVEQLVEHLLVLRYYAFTALYQPIDASVI